jgi:hypothetical protein
VMKTTKLVTDRVDCVVVEPSYGRFFGRFRGINYRDV